MLLLCCCLYVDEEILACVKNVGRKRLKRKGERIHSLFFFKDELLIFDYSESNDVSNDTQTGKLLTCISNILIRGDNMHWMQVFYDCNTHKSNYLKML